MRGLGLPTFLGKTTPEKMAELNVRDAQDKAYTNAREQNIKKKWAKVNDSLRKTGEYINNNFQEMIDLEVMSNEIDVAINVIKLNLADLNFWHEFGYKMKRVRGKKDFVQSVKKDLADTERYLTKKARTIASMEQVYGNISEEVQPQQKEVSDERQRQKEQAKEIEVKEGQLGSDDKDDK